MIFYFSGTGNSRWVAKQLARLLDDQTCDITALTEMPDVKKEKQIGFVLPVYAWGAAEPMEAFAMKLPKTGAFSFGVCTCGEEAGMAMKQFSKRYPLDSSYSLVMPNNYIVGTDTDDEATIHAKINAAKKELQKISGELLQRKKVYRVEEGSLAGLKSSLVNFGFNRFARSTKSFYATSLCNACGLCVKNCPAHTITMVNNLPNWGTRCYQCLRCINECPKQAIQYGKGTEGRRRYTIQNYLPQDEQ